MGGFDDCLVNLLTYEGTYFKSGKTNQMPCLFRSKFSFYTARMSVR